MQQLYFCIPKKVLGSYYQESERNFFEMKNIVIAFLTPENTLKYYIAHASINRDFLKINLTFDHILQLLKRSLETQQLCFQVTKTKLSVYFDSCLRSETIELSKFVISFLMHNSKFLYTKSLVLSLEHDYQVSFQDVTSKTVEDPILR